MKKNKKAALLGRGILALLLTSALCFTGCPSNDSGSSGGSTENASVSTVNTSQLVPSGATTNVTEENVESVIDELFGDGGAFAKDLSPVLSKIGEYMGIESEDKNENVRTAISEEDFQESWADLSEQFETFDESWEAFKDGSVDWSLSSGSLLDETGINLSVGDSYIKLSSKFSETPSESNEGYAAAALSGSAKASISSLIDLTKLEDSDASVVKGLVANIAYNASVNGSLRALDEEYSKNSSSDKEDSTSEEGELNELLNDIDKISGSVNVSFATSLGASFVTSGEVGGKVIANIEFAFKPSVSNKEDFAKLMENFQTVFTSDEELSETEYNKLSLPLSGKIKIAFYDDNGKNEYVYKETKSDYEVYKICRTLFDGVDLTFGEEE